MRYIFLIIAALLFMGTVHAQVGASINLNIGTQPVWGPTGYDHVDYYYLPDIDAYYNVSQHQFFYNENGRWIGRSRLPARYHSYDINNSYKVVVNEREPWRNDKMYVDKYSIYKGRHDQEMIRNSHDSKYFVNKNHPEHNNWVKQQKLDKNNGKGKDHGDNHDKNGGENKHGDQKN